LYNEEELAPLEATKKFACLLLTLTPSILKPFSSALSISSPAEYWSVFLKTLPALYIADG